MYKRLKNSLAFISKIRRLVEITKRLEWGYSLKITKIKEVKMKENTV